MAEVVKTSLTLQRAPDDAMVIGAEFRAESGRAGLVVSHLLPGGLAARGGQLQPGDVILSINGIDLTTMNRNTALEFIQKIRGEDVEVVVERGGLSSQDAGGIHSRQMHKEKQGEQRKAKELRFLLNETKNYNDTLHRNAGAVHMNCTSRVCAGSVMSQPPSRQDDSPRPKEELIKQAQQFIEDYYTSIKRADSEAHKTRWCEVLSSIEKTGTYDLTTAELTFGAKSAWRNAPRCIGRIQWSKLQLFDARYIVSARQMFQALCDHIKYATNKGFLRSAITIFPPRTDGQHDFKIWNPQLIRYCGYRNEDGSVLGDPASVALTEFAIKLGWKPPQKRSMFDIMPLVLQANGEDPEVFEVPLDIALEVEITHPRYPRIAELGLRWYALPAVANMMLDCGGLEFTGAPFNGWYMASEIASRDICEETRYNMLKPIAEKIGLDVTSNTSLWKDIAATEMNAAVLHSFQKQRVTITDHHSAAESFMKHLENEVESRGGCPADWVWVVPPISGSLTPVFHQEMLNYKLLPSYEYQDPEPWKCFKWKNQQTGSTQNQQDKKRKRKLKLKQLAMALKGTISMMRTAMAKRVKCTILYATETGRSKTFANQLLELFSHSFLTKVVCMEEYDISQLEHESLLLVVASTFGNGDPPDNGAEFASILHEMADSEKKHYVTTRRFSEAETLTRIKRVSQEAVVLDPIPERPDELIKTALLDNVKYGVFALGSSAYPNFCAFGKFVDVMLEKLGGQRIVSCGSGDELFLQEESFKEWSKEVYKVSCDTFCLDTNVSDEKAAAVLHSGDQVWSANKFRLVSNDTFDEEPDIFTVHDKNVKKCRIVGCEQLQAQESERRTILCRFDTQGSARLQYSPGDHLAIFPQQPKSLVDAVLEKVTFSGATTPDTIVSQEKYNADEKHRGFWKVDNRIPSTTLRMALTHLLDLTSPPSQAFLKQLPKLAESEEDQEKIRLIAHDPQIYDRWKHDNYPTMQEILEEFPSLTLPATFLLSQLPLLQQRFYSISSSPQLYPGEIHATVAVVSYRTKDGKNAVRKGVCSNWLNSVEIGTEIPCYVRKAPNFHLPKDQAAPLILVGPGTGIAPFRAFWQQRLVELNAIGPQAKSDNRQSRHGRMSLYFGCRKANIDNIYHEEKKYMAEREVLNEVHLALSRDPGTTKEYVQDHLMTNSAKVYHELAEEGGHIFVCGDVSMASDVSSTVEHIMMKEGNMTADDARGYIMMMRANNRFHEDIFGVTLKTLEVNTSARGLAKRKSISLRRGSELRSLLSA